VVRWCTATQTQGFFIALHIHNFFLVSQQPNFGPRPPFCLDFEVTHRKTNSVGLLWTRGRHVAKTFAWQPVLIKSG